MKRILSIVLALIATSAVVLAAFGIRNLETAGEGKKKDYKLGLGVVLKDGSKTAEAKATLTAAAVVTDDDGKIVYCAIDCMDAALSTEGGTITTGAEYLTKNDLMTEYGMAKYSPIGKEWFEQADHLSECVIGMDVSEVKNIALTDGGKATDADILAGCTIGITDMKEAIVKALEDPSAADFSAKGDFDISLGIITDDTASVSATEEAAGKVSLVSDICAMAVKDEMVSAAIIDVAEFSAEINTAGEASGVSFSQTKREKREAYGMAQYSGIGKEWYQQAEFFCSYIRGMDSDAIAAIEMNDTGKGKDADLTAGCTVAIGNFIKIASKTINNLAGGTYKLGLGIITTPDEGNGKAKSTVTIASVITDGNGKIVECVIDCADSTLEITDGKVATGNTFKTKNELSTEYGMAKYSPIGKEWFEQAAHFADCIKGLDKDGVSAIILDESQKATDTDILAGCTIAIPDIKAAVIKALEDERAVEFEATVAPSLTLGVITDDSSSSDASADKEGSASIMTTVCAMASAEGKAAASIIDITNPTFAFNTTGEITKTSFNGSKRELLDKYGMAQYSPIGKEWYEQAEYFCTYINGMTADDISAIVMNDMGKSDDTDLTAGCTIAIGDFIKIATKALSLAK